MPTATITESKNADSVLLGLGVLGLADLPRTSPDTYNDVGYIKQARFSYTRELKEFESGGVLVKRLVFKDRFELQAELAEVNIATLAKIIQGTLTTGGGGDAVTFGGHRNITRYALRFEHTKDDNSILQLDIYNCAPSGQFDLAFAEEDFIRYPVTFVAEADTAKTAGQRYGRIRLLT